MVLPHYLTMYTVNEDFGREKYAGVFLHNLSGFLVSNLKPFLNEAKDTLIIKSENKLHSNCNHLTKAYAKEAERHRNTRAKYQEYFKSIEDKVMEITSNHTQKVSWVQKIRLPMRAEKIIFTRNNITPIDYYDRASGRRIKDLGCHYTIIVKLDFHDIQRMDNFDLDGHEGLFDDVTYVPGSPNDDFPSPMSNKKTHFRSSSDNSAGERTAGNKRDKPDSALYDSSSNNSSPGPSAASIRKISASAIATMFGMN